jgi:DNA-binding Lrp family transcriptional regulator
LITDDHIQYGYKTLAKFLDCSVRTLYRQRKELQQCGVISQPKWHGNPRKKMIHWFPRVVMAYFTRQNLEDLENS